MEYLQQKKKLLITNLKIQKMIKKESIQMEELNLLKKTSVLFMILKLKKQKTNLNQ